MSSKKGKNEAEYIALATQSNKKYKIRNPFSEDVRINYKKQDISILEDDNGFTYLQYKNKKYLAEVIEQNQNKYTILLNGVSYSFSIETPISYKRKKYLDKQISKNKTEIVQAPMPGKIVDVLVEENAEVKDGESILILEAMKMQNEIGSPVAGKVKKVHVKQGDTVMKDDILLEIDK
jgi:glutaconyl-CoA/methylmalonyl-CoA decarboxylase subunit gamma